MTVHEAPAHKEAPAHEEPQAGGEQRQPDNLREPDNLRVFDEARLMANVSARAQRLFDDGYRARWTGGSALAIRNPQGVVYEVDAEAATCDCPFFQKYCNSQTRSGCRQKHYRCKHLLGYRRLLSRQRAARLLVALILLRVWDELGDAPASHKFSRTSASPMAASGAEEPEVTNVAF